MNAYQFNFLVEPTTPPVIGDAATLATLVKAIGTLAFAPGQMDMEIAVRPTITTGAYVATNATSGNPAVEISCMSRYRLPAGIMPSPVGATSSGTLYTAGGAIWGAITAQDDKCTEIITGLDRPVVTKGCGIVAYLPAGVDVSNELDAQISIPVCNGQTLVIGTAVQDAMQGTYETPFSTAWAVGIFGGRTMGQVAIVNVGGTATQRTIAGRAIN